MRFVAFILQAASLALARETFKEARLTIKKGGYDALPEELRIYLESKAENDVLSNKHIKIEESDEDVPTAKISFINSEGKEAEAVFAEHIPMSMLHMLIVEKEWEEIHEDL